ncbi:hypothetical protein TRFO_23463 [Tritrichomonas foetus]|uniref:RING-type E3 ubiquitin transferase n=1 Tax=Tritrichomonas foetus TaxID=1144522 RepID=A0A1J4KA62_9EUKA|nr:hypothetical protein TRFO_23463 [Tritrichomonas foetus]|eukprot:OHT08107.1 hypothetical protein TRFO_23463 [Tritrichomonas foetus]
MEFSSSQVDHGKCLICLDQMSRSGEHQICSLPCGHLFGYCCIKQWLDENQKCCPTCQKYAKSSMLRLIVWDGSMPMDNTRSDSIHDANKRAIKNHQELLHKLTRLERDYNICQAEISMKRRTVFGKVKQKTNIIHKPVSFPCLLMERKINDGFRICLSSKHLIYTCKNGDMNYGFEYCDRDSLSSFKYISLHTAQIHDLTSSPFDVQAVATVSLDKRLIVTAMRSEMSILEANLPVPLWSCAWISHSTIAVGGTNGKLFIVDGRGEISHDFVLSNGPPIFCIQSFSDEVLLVSTPLKSGLFDMRKFEFIKKDLPGAHSVSVSHLNHLVSVSRQNNNKTIVSIGSKTDSNNLVFNRTLNLDKFEKIARPAIVSTDTKDIFAIPDENEKGFKLLTSNNLDINYWSKWKHNFSDSDFNSPILDLAAVKEKDFLLATTSSDLVRMYAFPI